MSAISTTEGVELVHENCRMFVPHNNICVVDVTDKKITIHLTSMAQVFFIANDSADAIRIYNSIIRPPKQ
jgi:hypothetical protein